MESQTPQTQQGDRELRQETQAPIGIDFPPGSAVVYGLLGRCTVRSIETRQLGTETLSFYKLEIQKSALSRSTRQEPAVWVPVRSAREKGLRLPITAADLDAVMQVLSSREYYFQTSAPWSAVLSELESAINTEGAVGLSKVASFLHVLRRKQIVATQEVARMTENVMRVLVREMAEVTGETPRAIEAKIQKAFRHKMLPDN